MFYEEASENSGLREVAFGAAGAAKRTKEDVEIGAEQVALLGSAARRDGALQLGQWNVLLREVLDKFVTPFEYGPCQPAAKLFAVQPGESLVDRLFAVYLFEKRFVIPLQFVAIAGAQ
jgi:hypothetical protein